ncbi:YciI family protein [Sorangium sp. So ce367]|uniref:YciI family protein n=1 Tax=Sorangium sp. So ce367 TaxID=3133305 RepID=UPI003F648B9E
MHYIMLIYEPSEQFDERRRPTEDTAHWGAWRAYHQSLLDAGIYQGGGPLERPDTTATTIRVRGGERQVQDGPYADTKEQLGGFILLELPTLDAALAWASRCPAAEYGAVEVRPLADLTRIFGPRHGGPVRG